MSTCECRLCGQSFTGLTTFDKHQHINYDRRPAVTCLDPEALGMVPNARGRWGYPMDDEAREKLAALRGVSAETASSRVPLRNLSAEHALARVTGPRP